MIEMASLPTTKMTSICLTSIMTISQRQQLGGLSSPLYQSPSYGVSSPGFGFLVAKKLLPESGPVSISKFYLGQV